MKLNRSGLVAFLSLAAAAVFCSAALASPVAYVNVPMDTPQALVNAAITNINASVPTTAVNTLVTGAAAASTANAVRGTITTEALTTAALTDFTETLTNSSITTGSQVFVTIANGTNAAGDPIVAQVNPLAGSATIVIRNAHATNALNGTLKISFMVVN